MKKRSEIKQNDTWDISKMYFTLDDWKKTFSSIKPKEEGIFLELSCFKGKLKDSSKTLFECLKKYFEILQKLENLYVYAHLFLDQDLTNNDAKNIFGLITTLLTEYQTATSWIEPEILSIDTNLLNKYLNDKVLVDYRFYLSKLIKLIPHTLSEKEEKILAKSSSVLQVCSLVFSTFNNADLKFDNIEDKDGKLLPLSHGLYQVYLKSDDRVLRKNAFEKLHEKFLAHENSLTELFYGEIKNSLFVSSSRNYQNSLDAALFPNNIDTSVYLNLVKTIKNNIKTLHEFVSLKKQKLKLQNVHLYDLYFPLFKEIDFKFTYDEAKNLVIESTSVLGLEYQEILQKGITQDRWIDVYETENKRSGGYSSGCYSSYPYILLNYQNTLNDALTLAHECGHSMHSYFSNKTQKYLYSSYPIFLAEIASTLNELLFLDLLMKKIKNQEEKKFLINTLLDRINQTIFRQTLFADFELQMHSKHKEGHTLTPDLLKTNYLELYKIYYGKDFMTDDLLSIEWARIPHFYTPFYVYQYATGISIAISIFNKIKSSASYKDKYLNLLKSGGSDYPLDILKKADIDITKPTYLEEALNYFKELLKQI